MPSATPSPQTNSPITSVDGKSAFKVILAAFVFNQYGSVVDKRVQEVTLSFNLARLQANPTVEIPVDQQLQFTRGQLSVMLAVVDVGSGRSGNLQVALDVPAPPRN